MMKDTKSIWKHVVWWSKIAFVWATLNTPMVLMAHFVCWITRYNGIVCAITKVLCFLWSIYTSIAVIKYGDEVL